MLKTKGLSQTAVCRFLCLFVCLFVCLHACIFDPGGVSHERRAGMLVGEFELKLF